MGAHTRHKPWVLRLPISFQKNPLGLAVSVLFFLVGLAYLISGASQGRIAELLDNPIMLRAWGFGLCMATITLGCGIAKQSLDVEKMGLRLLSLTCGIFGIWITLAVGFTGVASIAMCILVLFFCQLRIGVIKQIQNPWVPPPSITGSEYDGG